VLGCAYAYRVGIEAGSALLPALLPAAVSLVRLVLGLSIAYGFVPASNSAVPLAIVLAACASDFLDGRLARALGVESASGRLLDNLCDFAFLLCMFVFFAHLQLWSPLVWGRLLRYWDGVNSLPAGALLASFGLYFVRLSLELGAGREPQRSPRGHAAGIANYALALIGAAELLPGVNLGPEFLEPVMLGVVLLNLAAVFENAGLMFHRERGGPRMPA
jgi:phosphatidylglycerophosphate synthase